MTQKQIIKIIGIKNYSLYYLLWFIEILINLPYKIVRIPFLILNFINDYLFSFIIERRIIFKLIKIKRVESFVIDIKNKLKKKEGEKVWVNIFIKGQF